MVSGLIAAAFAAGGGHAGYHRPAQRDLGAIY
jgi:hypothetical protein